MDLPQIHFGNRVKSGQRAGIMASTAEDEEVIADLTELQVHNSPHACNPPKGRLWGWTVLCSRVPALLAFRALGTDEATVL